MYAPQSPDLSGFHSEHTTTTTTSSSKPVIPTTSYAPKSPNLQPYTSTPHNNDIHSSFGTSNPFGAYQPPTAYAGGFDEYPSIPPLPASHNFGLEQQVYSPPIYQQQLQQGNSSFPEFKSEPYTSDFGGFGAGETAYATPQFEYNSTSQQHQQQDMSGRIKREGAGVNGKMELGSGPSQGIDVKTKFPVARIKRIMQADEEVGKVAQVTPVAVSKALELFMISLVTKSASLAKTANSKRVTAQHLKKAIESDEQFDFLNDIISKVVEGPEAGGKRVKDDDDSDDDEDKKPKKARGRKKKD